MTRMSVVECSGLVTLGRLKNTSEPGDLEAETAVGKSERYKLSFVEQMPLGLTHSTGTTHFENPIYINCAGDNMVARIRFQHYAGYFSEYFVCPMSLSYSYFSHLPPTMYNLSRLQHR
jgi:hypothetical protein